MSNTVILVALASEFNGAELLPHLSVVYTGVGKVNAALTTLSAISQYKPKHIINFGTAGGISAHCTGLVKVGRVIQRDMVAEPLAPRGVTPLSNGPHEFISGHEGITCGTGDSFVTSHDQWLHDKEIDVVDMELYAIAAAAHRMGIPWSAYKFVSDNANNEAANEWNEKINQGESLFLQELKKISLV